MVDDHDSWGNTTAQPQALATRQESLNGREEQLLASDEGAVAAYLGMGKSYEKERKLRSVAFIPRRRERGVCGPARQRPDAGIELDRQSQARLEFPLLGVADGWALVGI
jgi:hypothetical protein